MRRFFVERVDGGVVRFTPSDARHISRVLRLQPGDTVTVVDAAGQEYAVTLTAVGREQTVGRVDKLLEACAEPPVTVVLAQGLPKGDKMELIIQKGAELGVRVFAPLATERAVVRFDAKRAEERRERWQRIAREAAKQCRRHAVPEVLPVTGFAPFLDRIRPTDTVLMLWEGTDALGLKTVLSTVKPAERIILIVGPEGGFSPEEYRLARERGVIPVSLGARILRTETAGIAVTAVLMYHYGGLGG